MILSANSGSSSLKLSLYDVVSRDEPAINLILTATISSIPFPPAIFSAKHLASSSSQPKNEQVESIKDHLSAFAHFLTYLKHDAAIDPSQISHICHRIVHGGDFSDPILISEETYHHLEILSDLAPLHNSAALSVIEACSQTLPNASSIAFFDTAFHRSIPAYISTYAIDQTIAKERGLKKYGFHGLSYAFILRAVSKFLEKPQNALNLIVLHLGSGASVCAIKNGLSLDTSMGFTPLDGLPGATRSGSVDPSLIFHYTNKAGRISHPENSKLHITEAEEILNKKSGCKALTGTTDFGLIIRRAMEPPDSTNSIYRLAFDLFTDRVYNYVGSYYLKLDGQVDALVFAGGVGERSKELREVIAGKIRCLGFSALDPRKNAGVSEENKVVVDVGVNVTTEGDVRGKKILLCRTDEQLEMARQCALDTKFS